MTNGKQQTAVEWVVKQLWDEMNMQGDGAVFNALLDQALIMEKEQIINFGNYCIKQIEVSEAGELLMVEKPEDLYNETYGGDEQ